MAGTGVMEGEWVMFNVLLYCRSTVPPILHGKDPPTAQEERDVSIDCHVKANPPAKMVWEKENSTLTLENDRFQIYQTSELFRLTIKNVQKSDSGNYTCVAKSMSNTVRQDFLLKVEGNTAVE